MNKLLQTGLGLSPVWRTLCSRRSQRLNSRRPKITRQPGQRFHQRSFRNDVAICELAVAEKILTTNPVSSLYTPPTAKKGACPVMTATDVENALGAVEFREKVILHLAVFSGLRPGEILALRRSSVAPMVVQSRSTSGFIGVKSTRRRTVRPGSSLFHRVRRHCWHGGSRRRLTPDQTHGCFLRKTGRRPCGGITSYAAIFGHGWTHLIRP